MTSVQWPRPSCTAHKTCPTAGNGVCSLPITNPVHPSVRPSPFPIDAFLAPSLSPRRRSIPHYRSLSTLQCVVVLFNFLGRRFLEFMRSLVIFYPLLLLLSASSVVSCSVESRFAELSLRPGFHHVLTQRFFNSDCFQPTFQSLRLHK